MAERGYRMAADQAVVRCWLHYRDPVSGVRNPKSSQRIFLQSPVEGAAAEAQLLGGAPRVAIATGQRFPDEMRLDLLQAHVLDARRGQSSIEAKIDRPDHLACRHQHAPFDRVIEFADVAGPGMTLHRLARAGVEAGDGLA